jgi:hypothetical protein
MKKLVKLGNKAIMFGDSKCPACVAQYKIIKDSKMGIINYYDLAKNPIPKFIMDSEGNYSMPTWYIPTGNEVGEIKPGVIGDVKRLTNFGNVIPEIGTLAKYGKNFPDGQGINVGNSFMNTIEDKWGKGDSALQSGTIGRDFGPSGISKIYENSYSNDIRMVVPGGDLDTARSNNRNCNIINNPKAIEDSPGLIFDSKNPQIVSFGKKRNRFGPSYVKQTIGDYGGARQNEGDRPSTLSGKQFIASSKEYSPRLPDQGPLKGIPQSKVKFGKKKVGEGSVFKIKKGKITLV